MITSDQLKDIIERADALRRYLDIDSLFSVLPISIISTYYVTQNIYGEGGIRFPQVKS